MDKDESAEKNQSESNEPFAFRIYIAQMLILIICAFSMIGCYEVQEQIKDCQAQLISTLDECSHKSELKIVVDRVFWVMVVIELLCMFTLLQGLAFLPITPSSDEGGHLFINSNW